MVKQLNSEEATAEAHDVGTSNDAGGEMPWNNVSRLVGADGHHLNDMVATAQSR